MPDKDAEPELHEIITKYQMHWKKHSSTCRRVLKKAGKVYSN